MVNYVLLMVFGAAVFGTIDANKVKKRCTKPNEELRKCPTNCPPGVCGINDLAVTCLPVSELNCTAPACKCKFGFYRDDKGNCVTFEQCPTCGDNEVYDPCWSGCPPKRCDVDDSVIKCAAPPPLGDPKCIAGCRCADGYKRKDGICVPENQCQAFCYGENEVASTCINGGCFGARKCSEKGRAIICVDLIEGGCINGCLCKKGYLRDDLTGFCVPEDKCPATPSPKDPNQIYDKCPSNCLKRTCDSLYSTKPCSIGAAVCRPGYRCKDGYYKNSKNICVPKADCPCPIGKSFKDDCNTCSCRTGRRGDSPCTKIACNVPA